MFFFGGGSGGFRLLFDFKEDGCFGDRGNEVLFLEVDLNRVGVKVKG